MIVSFIETGRLFAECAERSQHAETANGPSRREILYHKGALERYTMTHLVKEREAEE